MLSSKRYMPRCRGFIFPLGVFTAATIRLGATLPSSCLSYLALFFIAALVALWVCVAAGTAHGAVTGHLFQAPCLASRPSMDLLVDAEALEESSVAGRKRGTGEARAVVAMVDGHGV